LAFDLDGTLIDSRRAVVRCLSSSFADHAMPVPSRRRLATTIGLSLRDSFRACSVAPLEAELLDSLIYSYRERYRAAGRYISLFPGVSQLVATLLSKRIPLAVATSKSREGTAVVLQQNWSENPFVCIVTDDDVTLPKPAPEMLELIARCLAPQPCRLVMIGDTSFDMQMGKAVGATTCGVSWGNHSERRLVESGADFVVHSPARLAGLIDVLLDDRAKSLSPASPFVEGTT
jgi:phosphoglycolate phosphatase